MRRTPPRLPTDTGLSEVSTVPHLPSRGLALTLRRLAIVHPKHGLPRSLCPPPKPLLVAIRTHCDEPSSWEINDQLSGLGELFLCPREEEHAFHGGQIGS